MKWRFVVVILLAVAGATIVHCGQSETETSGSKKNYGNTETPAKDAANPQKSSGEPDRNSDELIFRVGKRLPFDITTARFRISDASVHRTTNADQEKLVVLSPGKKAKKQEANWMPTEAFFKKRPDAEEMLTQWEPLTKNSLPPAIVGEFEYVAEVKLKSGLKFHLASHPGEPSALIFDNGDTVYIGSFLHPGKIFKKKGTFRVDLKESSNRKK